MRSWRETASQEAQDDLDNILAFALGFAQNMLDKRSEFYPFGAVLERGADLADPVLGFPDHMTELPDPSEVITLLERNVREQLAGLKATAVVTHVHAGGQDSVCVALEHADGISMALLLPYESKRFGRKKRYGELTAQDADARFWV